MPSSSFLGPFVEVPDGAAPAAAPGAAANRLPFTMQHPQPTEWCWAATTAAVATFYASVHSAGEAMTPCQVATLCLGPECCPEPTDPSDSRNQEYALEGALRAVQHLAADPVTGALDFQAIVNEIDGSRPVCCHIAWDPANPDNGHFNAVVGYDSAHQEVDVSDSLYGDQTLPYQTFAQAYRGTGTWDLTYLTS